MIARIRPPLLLLLIFLGLAAPLGAQRPTPTREWAGLDRFRQENEALEYDFDRVVFMGNSIVEGWAPLFPTLFPGKPYIGRGISGQTTAQMLVRFRQDVIDLRPQVVVILAGTNDIAENLGPVTRGEIIGNITSMMELAKTHGIRVVVCSVLPVRDYPWRPGLEPAAKIVALNRGIQSIVGRRREIWVDLHSAMRDEHGGMRPEFTNDGVHPNEAGYRLMSRMVEKGIAAAQRR